MSAKFNEIRRRRSRSGWLVGTTVIVFVVFSIVGIAAAATSNRHGSTSSGHSSASAASTHRSAHQAARSAQAQTRFAVPTKSGRVGKASGAQTAGRLAANCPVGTIGATAGFEDNDGNLAQDCSPLIDWNNFAPVAWTGSAPYQTGTATASGFSFLGITDAVVSTSDSAFAGGVKQNDECPVTQGSKAPNKDDLARAYIASKIVNGDTYLMLAWTRIPQNTPSADAHVAFEFNQSKTACSNGDGLVNRTKGDLLALYDFQSGSATISISTWDDVAKAWGAPVSLTANGHAEAQVNSGGESDAIAPGGPLTLGALEFGEAGIDLTKAVGDLSGGGKTCEQFGNVYAVSRSSGSSDTAQMEDLVGPAPLDISNCASPTITTQLSATSALPGTAVHDSAVLHSATADAGGSVTYSLYSDSTCTQNKQDAGTKTVTNGVVPDSDPITFNSEGTFYWQAVYTGDNNNNGATSECTDEQLVIAKQDTSITTNLSTTSAFVGAAVHDSATLSGETADAGGTVTYSAYSDSACTQNKRDAGTKTVTNGVVPDSDPITFNSDGDFYWQAVYSGDTHNNGSTSTCADEHLVINKHTPSISTVASGPVTIGGTIHDVATLSGAVGATGAVTFQVFAPGDTSCVTPLATLATATHSIDGDGNGTYTSANFTSAAVGDYLWRAFFAGDAKNAATSTACGDLHESSTVNPASPRISTVASGPVTIGGAIHDVATLSGAVGATGAVTFQVFAPGDTTCATPLATLDAVSHSTDAEGNGTYTSADFTSAAVGDYLWRAFFAADAKNSATSTACGDSHESSTVNPASPHISTVASGGVLVGAAIHDVATLSGAVGATGAAVTFKVYAPGDTTCATPLATLDAVSHSTDAEGNGTYTSADFTSAAVGDYLWRAFFAGDAKNSATSTACGDANESSTVLPLGTIRIVKNTLGGDGTFSFTGASTSQGVTLPTGFDSFQLSTTSGSAASQDFKVVPGDYTVGEASNVGWILTGLSCTTGTTANDNNGHADAAIASQADIHVNSGGLVQCTFTNTKLATLIVKKVVDNSNGGGTKGPGDFSIHVSTGGIDLKGSPAAGSSSGTTYSGLLPGTYKVSEDAVSGYSLTNISGCLADGSVILDAGATVTCTLTNTSAAPPPPPAPAPPAPKIDLAITKVGNPSSQTIGTSAVTWTLTVTNNGPNGATGVNVADPLPAGTTFISVSTTQGTCTGGALISCQLGSMAVGTSVTITLVTNPVTTGTLTNTTTVVGNEQETNTANNTATASVVVNPGVFKPPVVHYCTALAVSPKQLFVGRHAILTMRVSQHGKAQAGVRIRIAGSTLSIVTQPSNRQGIVKRAVLPKKAGIVTFKPLAQKGCSNPRIGVIGVFTPPVTG
jgi:uncharacterized repeat protein (TIGR01451 family)